MNGKGCLGKETVWFAASVTEAWIVRRPVAAPSG
jgi:hypothetical protein